MVGQRGMRDDGDDLPDGGGNGTWTRSQLLQHRGYPPDLANGNGAAGHSAVQPNDTVANVGTALPTVALAAPPARVCPGCGGEVTGSAQKVWCSPRCKRRQKAMGDHPTRPVPKPPGHAQGTGDGWGDILAALESAGAQVQFLSMNFAGSQWELTRW